MKRLIQLTLLTVLTLFTGVMAQVSTSKWLSQPIVIDGDGSDWGTNPRFFNAESNVKYEFRNDAQNLYLIIKSADRSVQMQLLKAGFNIKLKVRTSPPSKSTITFPESQTVDMPVVGNNAEGKTDQLIDKSVTRLESAVRDTAILEGFQYSTGKIASGNRDENGICFSRSKSPRELCFYEIRIPLRELFGNNYTMNTISTIPLQLQVNVNDFSKSSMKKANSKMGKGRSGGMGRGMGRGMGGGRNGGMGNDLQGQMETDLPGGNIGEIPGEEQMGGEMQGGSYRNGSAMERKSFSIDFHLSAGKTD